jgi:hypothetical protein
MLTLADERDEKWKRKVGLDPLAFVKSVPSPASLSPSVWLRTDQGVKLDKNGSVESWTDANGNVFTQSEAKNRPKLACEVINGKPVVRFSGFYNGATPLFSEKLDLGNLSGMTIFAAVNIQPSKVWNETKGKFESGGDRDGHLLLWGDYRGKSGSVALTGTAKCGIWAGKDACAKGSDLRDAGFVLLSATADAKTGTVNLYAVKLYRDGVLIANDNKPFTISSSNVMRIGGTNFRGASRGVTADVAELLVFPRVLDANERSIVETWLKHRYAFASDRVTELAAKLPFAYYPTTNEIELAFDKESPILAEYLGDIFRPSLKDISDLKPGLQYAIYKEKSPVHINKGGKSRQLSSYSKLPVEKQGSIDTMKNKKEFAGEVANTRAFMFQGYMRIPKDGVYNFTLRPGANAMLLIDGEQIVNKLGNGGYVWRGGAIALKAGLHRICLAGRFATLMPEFPPEIVFVRGPDMLMNQAIPPAWLYHNPAEAIAVPPQKRPESHQVPKSVADLKEVTAELVDLKSGKLITTMTLPLKGLKGQKRFSIPKLPDGYYGLAWRIGDKRVWLTQIFERRHFPWEGCKLGVDDNVYPPFKPIKKEKDNIIQVVDRTYNMNAFGVMDQVTSLGKKLLAAPIQLVMETDKGKEKWTVESEKIIVKKPSLAEVTGQVECSAVKLNAFTKIEEDGCMKVRWRLTPGKSPAVIKRAWIDIPFRDDAVPLFHFTGANSMRHNFAGNTPHGGKIIWDIDDDKGRPMRWVPALWRAEPGANDGLLWNSHKVNHWDYTPRDFVPYIWLGDTARGLAWFSGGTQGTTLVPGTPMQELIRKGDTVLLRIYFIQKPVSSRIPREISFGLQASPTKPMRPDWRTHDVPANLACAVVCWGGYQCSSKFPANRDFEYVDRFLGMVRTGKEWDKEWFDSFVKRLEWPDKKVFDQTDWSKQWGNRYGYAKRYHDNGRAMGMYYEEHATHTRISEWQIFMDEWSNFPFQRYATRCGNWSQAAPSYRDFALYYGDKWMKRGISLYFDNTNVKQVSNEYATGYHGDRLSIWEQREYYKRMWKHRALLNKTRDASTWEVDITFHITNTQVIPMNTWCTGTFDREQPYRMDRTRPPQVIEDGGKKWKADTPHFQMPFPPDYVRAMTLSRTVGAKPGGRHYLPNWTANAITGKRYDVTNGMHVINWGMNQVHETLFDGYSWGPHTKIPQSKRYIKTLKDFGYPDEVASGTVKVHNYWADVPFITNTDPKLTWIAFTRKDKDPFCAIVLQSYREKDHNVKITIPEANVVMDVDTGNQIKGKNHVFTIPMSGPYATRVLLASKNVKK